MPRLEALDDRALPSGMAGAQMMAAFQEHLAALQQRRELRLEAQQQRRELRLEMLQQRRELRLEMLQQRRPVQGFTTMTPGFPGQMESGTSPFLFPVKGTGPAMATPIAAAPVATPPVVAAPAATSSPVMAPSSPVMAPSAPMTAAAPATAGDPTTAGAPQPVPKADPHLNAAYEDFLAANGGDFTTSQAGVIEVVGTSVGVDVHGLVAAGLPAELSNLGMTVQHVDGPNGVVEGLLPLAELPAAANLLGVTGIGAVYKPHMGMVL
jgi:hypothetical protein